MKFDNSINNIYAFTFAIFFISGCVNFDGIHKCPEDWTPLESVSDLKRFEGKYENIGTGNSMGSNMPTHELWYFLTKQKIKDSKNAYVTINLSTPSTLDLTLVQDTLKLNEKSIIRYTLTQGKDFQYKGGSIVLSNSSGFSRDGFAMAFGTASFCIHLTNNGGLVGEINGSSAGLLLYLFPAFGFGRDWNYWEKIN